MLEREYCGTQSRGNETDPVKTGGSFWGQPPLTESTPNRSPPGPLPHCGAGVGVGAAAARWNGAACDVTTPGCSSHSLSLDLSLVLLYFYDYWYSLCRVYYC